MEEKKALFTSRKLISMARDPGRDDNAVAVKGGSILEVGPRGRVDGALGDGVATYDFGDRPIMPGFVDVHVHPGDGLPSSV